MTEPTTPTGKEFAEAVAFVADAIGFRYAEAAERIIAIEAEAKAQEREWLRAEVDRLDTDEFIDSYDLGTMWEAIDKRDIVRLLAEPTE